MAKYNTEEIINSSYENVKALSERLKDLDEMHKTLKTVVNDNTQIPIYFKNIVNEINHSTKVYLQGHKEVLSDTIIQFNNEISSLEKEIERLKSIDLKEHFDKHQGKLSEIFNSINGIQANFSSLSQNIINLDQNISKIISKVENNELKINREFEKIENSFVSIDAYFQKLIDLNKKQNVITWILIVVVFFLSLVI